MKKRLKTQKVVKGMPSAVLLSIVIHAALFLLAGMLVVFTVIKEKEVVFEPPKAVERPKMKLRKPKVKVKKTSKPKPTTRIVTKMNRATMPDIQLPEMSGMAESLGSGLGGFDMMPNLDKISVMGSGQSIGNDLVGTFYDYKRDRTGRPIPYSYDKYVDIARKFFMGGWNTSMLSRFYKSPKKIYATTIMIPPILSTIAPSAFGEDADGNFWLVHYKGKLVHQKGITFRFMGFGEGLMGVRVDGKNVLAATMLKKDLWQSSSADSEKYWMGTGKAIAGDWITLEPGVPLDMEVMISDGGDDACFMLAIEEKGVEYERRTMGGGPTFPAFKTAEPSHDLLDAIYKNLVPGEVTLTNGPVFSDYGAVKRSETHTSETVDSPEAVLPKPTPPDSILRTWTTVDGKIMAAEFITVIGDKVVLKNPKGKQKKVPLAQLSAEDLGYVELANPPVFKIDFNAKTEQVCSIVDGASTGRTVAYDYCAKVRLKQTSAGAYNHELCVEFFAVGEEIHGNRYVLLDRQKSCFIPTEKNARTHEFSGRPVEIPNFTLRREGQHRGEKPYGYLITVTDSRGIIIQHKESNPWLYENREKLKQLKVGVYLDKGCNRVFPTGPKRSFY